MYIKMYIIFVRANRDKWRRAQPKKLVAAGPAQRNGRPVGLRRCKGDEGDTFACGATLAVRYSNVISVLVPLVGWLSETGWIDTFWTRRA